MSSLIIAGGEPLSGYVSISGAKNAALPACVASLLTEDAITLHSVPQLRDVNTMLFTLGALGKRVVRNENDVSISAGRALIPEANAYSVSQMRATFNVLGPLVARLGHAIVPLPGGCAIGARPVDLHLVGLRALGAQVEERGGVVIARARKLQGNAIHLPYPSVGATEQIMMAACLAEGVTTIGNASVEPEVLDVIALLRKMGGDIELEGNCIRISGCKSLGGAEHTVIPDRMEAGTFLLSATITRGRVTVGPVVPEHMSSFLNTLTAMGTDIEIEASDVTAIQRTRPSSVAIETDPYPGFPTDLHPQIVAALAIADGTGRVTETVFERRFAYITSLNRMGAQTVVDGNALTVRGVRELVGCAVEAPDIRGGAALVLAGLSASGQTQISGLPHLDRGHEDLTGKLKSIGASLERREDPS